MFRFLRSRLAITVFVALLTFAVSPIALVATTNYQARAQEVAGFRTGDLLVAANNTTGTDWSDPVLANPGEAVEFNMLAQNIVPNSTAHNVVIAAFLPSAMHPSPLVAQAYVFSNDGGSVNDTVTVNFTGAQQQTFQYIPGHTRIFSPTCPSGCAGPDTVLGDGVPVGDLNYGESAQVLWKAYVSNFVVEQPTPTPTLVPTPTPTLVPTPPPTMVPTPPPTHIPTPPPTIVPTPVPTLPPPPPTQVQNQTNNQNQNVTVNVPPAQGAVLAVNTSAQPKVIATSGTPITTLPKTGLPLAGWALMGLLPAGAGLKKKLGLGSAEQDETANFIWEEREFKKS